MLFITQILLQKPKVEKQVCGWVLFSELTVIWWADVKLFLKDLMCLADFPVMFIKYQKMLKTSQVQQFNGHVQARFAAEQKHLSPF